MLHLSDTSRDNEAPSCCWICLMYPRIHMEFDRISFDSRWELFFWVFFFGSCVLLPSLNVFMPETSVADKHSNCMPALGAPKDHGGVFVHPCTTCSGGKDTNGRMVILCCVPFVKGPFFFFFAHCGTQRDAEVEEKMRVKSITQLLAWHNEQLTPLFLHPRPRPLLHLLISPLQSCAHGALVYSSFQWSTSVITMTGSATLWQDARSFSYRWPTLIQAGREPATRRSVKTLHPRWCF